MRTSPFQIGKRFSAFYLRSLYRDGRLTATELNKRLRTLNDLATGKLRPDLPTTRPPRA